jgi:hypothetical protein
MLEEIMEQRTSEEREFTGKGMATMFGAPISWIALFGALMGALSIVPMIFYPFGGGFASAGMIIFGPMAGLILGPWAGAIAGVIGGLIGMFISPGSYPLGFIDVLLSGAFLPIFWGLARGLSEILCPVGFDLDLYLGSLLHPWGSGRFWGCPSAYVHPLIHLGSSRANFRAADAGQTAEMDARRESGQTSLGLHPVHGWSDLSLAASVDRRVSPNIHRDSGAEQLGPMLYIHMVPPGAMLLDCKAATRSADP